MRLPLAMLAVIVSSYAFPGQSSAQTPPNGYWRGWNGVCPDAPDPLTNGMCSSPLEACQSLAAWHGGTLTNMKPSLYTNGELAGYDCTISSLWFDEYAQLICLGLGGTGYMRSFAGCLPEIQIDPRAFDPPTPCATSGNRATGGASFGNPTIVANGARRERVVDIEIAGEPALTFARYYYGQMIASGSLGVGWASDLDRALGLGSGTSPTSVTAQWPTGRRISFTRTGTSPSYTYAGDDDTEERLTQTASGWELRGRDDRVESYDKLGRLVSLRWRNGYQQRLVRDEGRVLVLVDSFQRTLRFTYQDDLLASVTDPSGQVYRYDYEAPSSFEPKRLSNVIYPDATPADPNDNPFVRYLYEDTRFAYALTGMIDEKGVRFATWQYDAEMRVVSSEHAGGVDRFTASYDRTNRITTITNPLTKETRHHFALVEGKWKPTRVEGRPSAGCAAADQLLSYDSKGFVASRTDWNGNVTGYVNDSRGLPTSITEAVARRWHVPATSRGIRACGCRPRSPHPV